MEIIACLYIDIHSLSCFMKKIVNELKYEISP